jgi:putative transposase
LFDVCIIEGPLREGFFYSMSFDRITSPAKPAARLDRTICDIQRSMNGKGRACDNILIERLLHTLKYEELYLNRYETGEATHKGIEKFFDFYNKRRPHQTLDCQTPSQF